MLHRDVQFHEVKHSRCVWIVLEPLFPCRSTLLPGFTHRCAPPWQSCTSCQRLRWESFTLLSLKMPFVFFVCIFNYLPDTWLYFHYNFPCSFCLWNCKDVEIVYEMIIATLLVSAQIPELTKSTVLMRERSRVEKTIRAMQHTGAGGLQVNSCSILLKWLNTLDLC